MTDRYHRSVREIAKSFCLDVEGNERIVLTDGILLLKTPAPIAVGSTPLTIKYLVYSNNRKSTTGTYPTMEQASPIWSVCMMSESPDIEGSCWKAAHSDSIATKWVCLIRPYPEDLKQKCDPSPMFQVSFSPLEHHRSIVTFSRSFRCLTASDQV